MKKRIASILTITALFGSLSPAQDSAFLELGKQTYAACSLCHGADGKGAKAGDIVMAPSLFESQFVKEKSAEALSAIVLKGIAKEDNKYLQQMVPLEAAFDDEKLCTPSNPGPIRACI